MSLILNLKNNGFGLTVAILVGTIVDDAAFLCRFLLFHPHLHRCFAGFACDGVDFFAGVAVAIAIAASTSTAQSIIESVVVF